jgi:hypothetical protein
LSDGAKPSIGTTLTPVKPAKAKKTSTKAAKAPTKAVSTPTKVATTPTKSRKSPKVELAEKKTVKAVKKSPAKATKTPPKPKKATKALAVPQPPAVALRRGRHPVNPEADFALFRSAHRIGSRVEGEVTDFTSHGAVIKVALKTGQLIECYAPTNSLGNPAPARARDVLKRGDHRTFRLVAVDVERRIAELALV